MTIEQIIRVKYAKLFELLVDSCQNAWELFKELKRMELEEIKSIKNS